MEKTLASKVSNDFSMKGRGKSAVKVPKLKARERKAVDNIPTSFIINLLIKNSVENAKNEKKKDGSIPTSLIINLLIKNSVENAKKEKKKEIKLSFAEDRPYTLLKEDKEQNIGGYGTIPKNYGLTPHTSYVDYGKLFSYLGKFKSQSPYENTADPLETLNKATESGSFTLADKDSMDKIGRFDKYMKSPVTAIQTMALSLVPIAGLSSGEWEEIKNLMRFDPVMYTLKSKTS